MYPGDPLNTIGSVNFHHNLMNKKQPTSEWKLSLGDIRLCGRLMWVRTIPQHDPLDWPCQFLSWQLSTSVLFPEIPADCLIVPCHHFECFQRKRCSQSLPYISFPVPPHTEEGSIILWIGEDRDTLVVLCCGMEECYSADVNFFDCIC